MKNIDIRYPADIGVSDIDVYKTGEKSFSATSPKLLMFFRSEDQAMGLPKEDKNSNRTLTYLTNTIKDIIEDRKYDQSFGFDIFRENLLGNNSKIYKINEDSNGNYILNGDTYSESDTGFTLEKSYDKTSSTLVLVDGNRTYHINDEFKLKRGNSPLRDSAYYAPNILIKPGKEVVISVKYFDTDNSSTLAQNISFKLSDSKGIEYITPNITVDKNEQIVQFKIKTKTNETVDAKSSIIASVKDASDKDIEIGRLTILPNKLYEPKLIFVDVFYKKNTLSTTSNYIGLASNLNNKGFNQASVNFILGKNQIINVSDTDFPLKDPTNTLGPYFQQNSGTKNYETTQGDSLGKALKIVTSKFLEKMSKEILQEIEKNLQNFDINDGTTTRKLIQPGKTLQDWFTQYSQSPNGSTAATKWYDRLVENLYSYIDRIRLGIYPMFMCNNIVATKDDLATGFNRDKGLIIPSNALSDIMTLVHELGHNFGLRHTFDKPNHEKGDIKIKPMQTLENIMDYLSDNASPRANHCKNFITYQIDTIRRNSERLKYNVDDLKYVIEKETVADPPQMVIKDFSNDKNLETFSKNICRYLFDSYQGIYNLQDDTKLLAYREKILLQIVDVLKTYFKNL
ncbi:hypothetical protein [Chryseobacterium phocaeense]|uniref:hypothetical protein n=1 Tax=Chryseobacterium phocaeense TaxID=1816690 RepID=UPI0009BA6BAA|nr:hypothetical protein [Chryseobacterium phocaeense]